MTREKSCRTKTNILCHLNNNELVIQFWFRGRTLSTFIMTFTRRHIIGLVALTGAIIAAPAYAAPHHHGPHAVRAHSAAQSMGYVRYAQKAISASKAKAIAAKRVRGAKFVDISRSSGKYRVRMLRKDGRVVDVLIDAATGRVLN